ncbi:MAG: helix-turn-helix transcriptional regulator [Acidobacteria bacterium]|nr:helix-turn-helix transcriptional regulator [Acidobacteriota bacterium]
MATTGDRIRQVREARGLTQEQLANSAKVSKSFLSDVENNNKNLSSQLLLQIATALGASVDYLLSGSIQGTVPHQPVTIPPNLSTAAAELNLTYNQTLELLNAQLSVIARRSNKSERELSVKDWKDFHFAIKKLFG